MPKIETYEVKAGMVQLTEFDCLAKPGNYMEVALWHNGEGFDVQLSREGLHCFQLTWGEFKALKRLVKELDG